MLFPYRNFVDQHWMRLEFLLRWSRWLGVTRPSPRWANIRGAILLKYQRDRPLPLRRRHEPRRDNELRISSPTQKISTKPTSLQAMMTTAWFLSRPWAVALLLEQRRRSFQNSGSTRRKFSLPNSYLLWSRFKLTALFWHRCLLQIFHRGDIDVSGGPRPISSPAPQTAPIDEVYPRQCPCRRAFDLGSVLGDLANSAAIRQKQRNTGIYPGSAPLEGKRPTSCLSDFVLMWWLRWWNYNGGVDWI
jgi:hypothetical protein